MRPLWTRPAALVFALFQAALTPAAAQVKVDLGAAASAGAGASGAAGASALNNPAALPAPALGAALSPSVLSAAPAAALAPAARPDAAALPASALAAIPAPAAAEPPQTPKTAAAAAALPAPPEAPAASERPMGPVVFAVHELEILGVPDALIRRLMDFIATRSPGNQNSIYHGLGHSREVASFTARVVEQADIPAARKVLLILAGALHDVDPERVPDTPARVAATIQYLDEDPEARSLVADFASRYGFTPKQVDALILATDFSADPVEMKARQQVFETAAAAAFPGEDFGLVWGHRLAFVDQSATYLSNADNAEQRVRGLAHEIRTQLEAIGIGPGPTDAQKLAGTGQFLRIAGPTDAQMLAGTGKFLAALRQDPAFAVLPADLQERFVAVESYFAARQTPEAWTASAAPVPARAPPDVEAAQRYVRGIAAGIKLDERQTDGLLEQFFEEHGIAPSSERADAVRREMLPSKVAAEDKAVAGLSLPLRKHRAALLRIAAERKTTPAAIEAVLGRRSVLDAIAHLGDAEFTRQTELALHRDELERAVAGYPKSEQGRFMREIAGHMATPSGKSVEEVARDGVFAYVDFNGTSVRRAYSGRDPDVEGVQAVFYVTRRGGRWRIDGYRQNRDTGRSDAELEKGLKTWLTNGGVPESDLE